MKMLIFGGFLGSGKTTVIRKVLHGIVNIGQTAAVIENEIGEIGIDNQILSDSGVSITPLFGGCVCCTISGSLVQAVNRIQFEINPDWLVIEMTGLALMSGIRDVFRRYGNGKMAIRTVSIVDSGRFLKLLSLSPELMENQVSGADAVLLNKIDLCPVTEELLCAVHKLTDAPVLPISASDVDCMALCKQLFQALKRHPHEKA